VGKAELKMWPVMVTNRLQESTLTVTRKLHDAACFFLHTMGHFIFP